MRPPAAEKKELASSPAVAAKQLVKKGPWTAAEDAILTEYVTKNGGGNWNALQKNCGLQRCGKSCRLRWLNHLRPNLRKDSFSLEEKMLIHRRQAEFGNKWSRIAAELPGRTDNEIKNYWNTMINRRKRAGLPLHPLEIHEQGQSTRALSRNEYGSIIQDSNTGKNISFQVPYFSSPVQSWLGNFDFGRPSNLLNVELPSSQSSSDSGGEQMPQGNSGHLDTLFQESHGVGKSLSSKCLDFDRLGNLGYLDCSLGIRVIEEMLETEVSPLIDKILTEMTAPTQMTVLPDWCNNSSCGGEFWNGSSWVDEEIKMDMQQSDWMPHMAPVVDDYGFGSCSLYTIQWNNMPRIC